MKDTYLALVITLAIWVGLSISVLTPNYGAVASTSRVGCSSSNTVVNTSVSATEDTKVTTTVGPLDIPEEAPEGVKNLMVRMDKIDARSKALAQKLVNEK